jgi:hypothetical protein
VPLSVDLAKSHASCLTWQSIVPMSAVAASPPGHPPAGGDCGMGIAPAQSAVTAHSTAKACLIFEGPSLGITPLIRAFFSSCKHEMGRMASVALLLLHAAACECMAKLEKGTPTLPAFALSSSSGAQLQALFPPMPNHRCPATFSTPNHVL